MIERARIRRDPTSGLGFCRDALAGIAERTVRSGLDGQGKQGTSCVIFDIDNTLVDTRARTQAAAHVFGRRRNHAPLARLRLEQVGYDGKTTADGLGLGQLVTRSFASYWDTFFWDPASFRHDRPIRQTIQLARQAKQAGAEVFYLTGRIEELKPGTIQQLCKLGLPDADGIHVICKPDLGVKTAPFKQRMVDRMLGQRGRRIAWFMSDSTADIAHVRDTGVACVWVDFPTKPSDGSCRGSSGASAPLGVPTIRLGR